MQKKLSIVLIIRILLQFLLIEVFLKIMLCYFISGFLRCHFVRSGIIYYLVFVIFSSSLLQGNILSPKFFNAYMDELLFKLEESGLGCKLYNVFCGI